MNTKTARLCRRYALVSLPKDAPDRIKAGAYKAMKRAWNGLPWTERHAMRKQMAETVAKP